MKNEGSSEENAIVVTVMNETEVIEFEYDYISKILNSSGVSWEIETQDWQPGKNKLGAYDVIGVKLANGTLRNFFFDITSFFGKTMLFKWESRPDFITSGVEALFTWDKENILKIDACDSKVISFLTKKIEYNPKDISAYKSRGKFYHNEIYNYDNAIADYTEAIKINPNNTESYILRGSAFNDKGEKNNAIADYTKAIEIDQKSVRAYLARADFYFDEKDYDKAITDCTEAIKINPNNIESHILRGRAFKNKGENNNAIADYTKAIENSSTDSRDIPYDYRATAYFANGEHAKAIEDWNRAIQIDPSFCSHYFWRAEAYYKIKEYDKALYDILKAKNLGYPMNKKEDELFKSIRQAKKEQEELEELEGRLSGSESKKLRRKIITENVRIAVWKRDGGSCVNCSSREKLEYDHIIPVSKGGSNTVRNIELLCETCNRKKRDRIG